MPIKPIRVMILISVFLQATSGISQQTSPNGLNKDLLDKFDTTVQHFAYRNRKGIEKIVTTVVNEGWFEKLLSDPWSHSNFLYNLFHPDIQRALAQPFMKQQPEIPLNVPFPCNISGGRSTTKPTSVNRLRPGDIDLVAQFGDSIAHGTGLLSLNVAGFMTVDQDVAMFIGGRATWRQYLTLPNILKEYNPHLKGYATGPVRFGDVNKVNYDFAEAGYTVKDLLKISKKFVNRLKKDKRISLENDWKMVTIFIGGIDHCQYLCHVIDKEKALAAQKKAIEDALDYLMENSPRTIVNFVVFSNYLRTINTMQDVPPTCQLLQRIICNCLFFSSHGKEDEYLEYIDRVVDEHFEAASNPKYQQKEDFAVLVQTFGGDIRLPLINSKSSDYRYLATDCIHWSQRLHAAFGVAAWNSLLTPFGQKPHSLEIKYPFHTFKCPTEDRPFIATPRNSNN